MADKERLLTAFDVKYISKTSRYRGVPQYGGFAVEDDFVLYPDLDDTQFVVDSFTAGRADLIAYAIYDNPLYAWVLMRRNGILHPSQIKPGMILWVPSEQRVHAPGGILSQ